MNKKSSCASRTGAVLLVVMACLAIAVTLIIGWARIALLENHQARSVEDRLQAEWLADSAIGRAAAQLLANPAYQGETWRITAADFGRRPAGTQPPAAVPDTKPAPETGAANDTAAVPAPATTAGAETVLGEALITVEAVPDHAGSRRVSVRADFPVTRAAGTGTGHNPQRISKQAVFELPEPTAN